MTTPVSIRDQSSAEHYTWGSVCDGWHLLKQPDLSVIQERVPPGAGETEHFHSVARQLFFVISGEATLEFSEQSVTFTAGQCVHVEPGVHHRFVNRSFDDVVFLVISSPTTTGDRTNVRAAN